MPRTDDLQVQKQVSKEGGSSEKQDSEFTSVKAIQYLVQLNETDEMVNVCVAFVYHSMGTLCS